MPEWHSIWSLIIRNMSVSIISFKIPADGIQIQVQDMDREAPEPVTAVHSFYVLKYYANAAVVADINILG